MKSEQLEKVLAYIKQKGVPVTPTEIGTKVLGFDYCQASSRANPIIKRLLAEGKIEKTDGRGKYVAVK